MVRTSRDLEIILKRHWYRVPVRHLAFPQAGFLAPYLTRSCGARGGAISFYAPIVKIERRRRGEILPQEKDHPRAGDWYWLLRLGPINLLPRRIENLCRRRITFAYTDRRSLDRAREIGELFAIPPLEVVMKKILAEAEIPHQPQFNVREKKRCRYRLDFAVFCRRGRLAIECDHSRWHHRPRQRARDRIRDKYLRRHGWQVLHFTETDILIHPLRTRRSILSHIRRLGGVLA